MNRRDRRGELTEEEAALEVVDFLSINNPKTESLTNRVEILNSMEMENEVVYSPSLLAIAFLELGLTEETITARLRGKKYPVRVELLERETLSVVYNTSKVLAEFIESGSVDTIEIKGAVYTMYDNVYVAPDAGDHSMTNLYPFYKKEFLNLSLWVKLNE